MNSQKTNGADAMELIITVSDSFTVLRNIEGGAIGSIVIEYIVDPFRV